MTHNEKMVTMKLKRIDVCNLLLACTSIDQMLRAEGKTTSKWKKLHDELDEILKAFDKRTGLN